VFLLILLAFPNQLTFVKAEQPKVYCQDEMAGIIVYHPSLQVIITKTFSANQPGGRISSLTYNNKQIVNTVDPRSGNIRLCNSSAPSQTVYKYPNTCEVLSIVGNNTEKMVITLTTSNVTNYDGSEPLPIRVTIEYTFYADISNFYVWVNLNSSIMDYRLREANYGASLGFTGFQKYEVYGAKNTLIGCGDLKGDSKDYPFSSPHLQIRLKNETDKKCVTVFPLSIFPNYAWVRDQNKLTWIYLSTIQANTYDTGVTLPWGSYIRDISYGIGWAFYTEPDNPYVVTPWIMPNAVPNGIAQSYDELPQGTYDIMQPNSSASSVYQFWRWLSENPKRRTNLMLGYDMLTNGGYIPNETGVDKSWEQHGNLRLCNATTEWKNWLANIEGTNIGYGMHAYHHDYPWTWEFSDITNTTWIDATLNQIYQDNIAIGLRNQTHFKAPGFNIQPQALDYLIKYGIKYHHLSFCNNRLPLYSYYVDSNGKILLQGFDGWSVDSYITANSAEEIYSWIQSNMTEHGLLFLHGHFFNSSEYDSFNQVFNLLEQNNDFDYFLIEDLVDYWTNVLLPLKYTYNTTMIETNGIRDERLTFRLIGGTEPTSGLVYSNGNITLYDPNRNTGMCKFLRLSGYANLVNIVKIGNELNFSLCGPSGTMGTASVSCGNLGTPIKVYVNNTLETQGASWNYDSDTNVLTISWEGHADVNVLFFDNIPPEIGIPTQNPAGENVQAGQKVKVSVSVNDYSSGVQNVTLFYMLNNDGVWNPLPMNYNASTNIYEATIPGHSPGTIVTYEIVAYNNFGNLAVNTNSGEYYKYTVIPEPSSPTVAPSPSTSPSTNSTSMPTILVFSLLMSLALMVLAMFILIVRQRKSSKLHSNCGKSPEAMLVYSKTIQIV
jgi:hypothetical protein